MSQGACVPGNLPVSAPSAGITPFQSLSSQGLRFHPTPAYPTDLQLTWWNDGFAAQSGEGRALHSSTLRRPGTVFREDPDGLAGPMVVDCHPIRVGSAHTAVCLTVVPTDRLSGSAEGLGTNEHLLACKLLWYVFLM